MTNKKTLFISLGTLVGSCLLFITIGSLVNASQDKGPAFTGAYDVSVAEELLVVTKEDEMETLSFLPNKEKSIPLFESEVGTSLFSPVFTEGNTATFIQTTGYEYGDDPDEVNSELAYSTIFSIDLSTNKVTILAKTRGILLDLVYIPTTNQLLVAGENINQQAEPQTTDRNETKLYHVNEGELEVIYEGSYAMPGSMQPTADGQLMMILPDDQGNWNVDSMFESIERIYIADPSESPLKLELVSNPDKTEPISRFVQVDDGLIYQTIFNYHDSDDMFDYDLVPYSLDHEEEGDRLGISGHEIESLNAPKNQLLYYVKRTATYRNGNDFTLHRHHLESGNDVEIELHPQTEE